MLILKTVPTHCIWYWLCPIPWSSSFLSVNT